MDRESRRNFLKKTAALAAGAAGISALGPACSGKASGGGASSGLIKSAKKIPATVVVARDPSIWRGNSLDHERVKNLLFSAMRKLAGAKDDAAAWKMFFSPSDKPGIKLNCLSGKILSSTPALAAAVADGLLLAGVAPSNIIFWDRTEKEMKRAGFATGRDGRGVLFSATDDSSFGYDEELTESGEVGSLVSRIASAACNSLINIPVLKDHDLVGVSGAMKNYFGAINNPNKLHDNGCDPYVADLNTMPVFRDKTRLAICDATTAQCHGGPGYKPQYAWKFSGILLATDMVALDTVAWSLIAKKRREKGLPTLEKEERPPKYIASAAARGLGENNLKKIKIIEIGA